MRGLKYCLLALIKICFVVCYSPDYNPIVKTNLGRIKGSIMTTRTGKQFLSFRGIRYGQPPIGNLRFKAPQPVTPWDDIFDATDDGPLCPQPFENKTMLSEDCLRLNVYTHSISANTTTNKKSVLLFLHGGGYYMGSGVTTHYAGPQYLMDRDIVLVTMNYRLGSLGFLSLGTEYCPGNAAFKDQVLVMKWIRDHIEHFDGDPNSVTIMGNSGGGWSVAYHMISPMSQGLFHRAIAMSGTYIIQPYYKTHQISTAKRQARILNCPEEPLEMLFDCLKLANSEEMSQKLKYMFISDDDLPVVPWNAVVEPDFGQERFLIEDPNKSFQTGNFSDVPIIIGITRDELLSSAVKLIENSIQLNNLDANFDKVVPICVGYERGTEKSIQITNAIREFYNLTSPLTKDHLAPLNHLISDSVLGFGAHRLVQLLCNYTNVYYYKFSYAGRYSHFYYPENKTLGIEHSDDLLYLFIRNFYAPKFIEGDPESITIERMTRMWANFVSTGDPNNSTDTIIGNTLWKPVQHDHEYYLEIGNQLELKEGLYTDRYKLWDELYPIEN